MFIDHSTKDENMLIAKRYVRQVAKEGREGRNPSTAHNLTEILLTGGVRHCINQVRLYMGFRG
jgi:hypothetical protein